MKSKLSKRAHGTETARKNVIARIQNRIDSAGAVEAAGWAATPRGGKKGTSSNKAAIEPRGAKDPQTHKAAAPGRTSPMSGLDAAAKILADAKKPMNCKALVSEAFKKGYWRSEGATPEATIYAAIIREIARKRGRSRFIKTGRGTFAPNANAM